MTSIFCDLIFMASLPVIVIRCFGNIKRIFVSVIIVFGYAVIIPPTNQFTKTTVVG